MDSGQHYSSSKRFNLCIDGLQDAFIKDKVIDIMTYFSNQYDLTYTLNNNYASVCCKPEIFSKLIQFIACRNIDILSPHIKLVHYIMHVFLRVVKGSKQNVSTLFILFLSFSSNTKCSNASRTCGTVIPTTTCTFLPLLQVHVTFVDV